MSNNEGTIFVVIQLPKPWPLAEDRILVTQDVSSGQAQIVALRTGQLRLRVEGTTDALSWTSQPIAISGNGLALITAIWGATEIGISINGKDLLEGASVTDVYLVETREHAVDPIVAWDQPTKDDACFEWTVWRAKRFATSKQVPREGRRLKSEEEQVGELRRAAQSTTDLANLVLQGHTHLLGHLATELRALLFWRGRHYDPLLLRLAARKNLSLPVFVVRDTGPLPVTDGLLAHVRRGMASHNRILPTHSLVDLQEWLMSPAVSEPSAKQDDSSADTLQHMSVIEVIAGIADTLGAAHYDQDTPTALDLLRSLRGPNGSEIVVSLVEAARVVVPLCVNVANQFAGSPPNI